MYFSVPILPEGRLNDPFSVDIMSVIRSVDHLHIMNALICDRQSVQRHQIASLPGAAVIFGDIHESVPQFPFQGSGSQYGAVT